jgi:beta-galactosidase GanA
LLWQIGLNKDSIDYEKIKKAQLFILAAPKDVFTPSEVDDLKKYVDNGGNLLVLSHEGGDRR